MRDPSSQLDSILVSPRAIKRPEIPAKGRLLPAMRIRGVALVISLPQPKRIELPPVVSG